MAAKDCGPRSRTIVGIFNNNSDNKRQLSQAQATGEKSQNKKVQKILAKVQAGLGQKSGVKRSGTRGQ